MSRTLVEIMSEGEARTQAHTFRNLAGVTAEVVYAQRGHYAVLITQASGSKTVCLTWDTVTELRGYLYGKQQAATLARLEAAHEAVLEATK